MRTRKPHPVRTTLDLGDEAQVKSLRRRLGLSNEDLVRIVTKVGNSIAAISKEVEIEQAGNAAP
jgi:hypothetical protein